MMEPTMMQHVMTELYEGNLPFLKIRAIWLYGEFGDFHFKDHDHVQKVVDLIYRNLYD